MRLGPEFSLWFCERAHPVTLAAVGTYIPASRFHCGSCGKLSALRAATGAIAAAWRLGGERAVLEIMKSGGMPDDE